MTHEEAITKLTKNGFSIVSTKRQRKNNTIMCYNPRAAELYTIHQNGYVRRRLEGYGSWAISDPIQKRNAHYPINPRHKNSYAYILFPNDYDKQTDMVISNANRRRHIKQKNNKS